MFLRTPTKKRTEKSQYTPPRGDVETKLDGPTRKFLKSLSGKAHLTFDSKSRNISHIKTPDASPHSKVESKRNRNLPLPLDLSTSLSNTTDKNRLIKEFNNFSEKRTHKIQPLLLGSPSKITRKNSNNSRNNSSLTAFELKMKNSDTMSPIENSRFSTTLSLMSETNASKKYVNETCCICDEHISATFLGEKTIEFECGHISHYECYLLIFEGMYNENKHPNCQICGANCEPLDDDIISDITSRILTSKKKMPNYYELAYPTYNTSAIPRSILREQQNTPVERIIQSSQVTSRGFKTPTLDCNPFEDISLDDDLESEYIISSSSTSSIIINGLKIDLEEKLETEDESIDFPIVNRTENDVVEIFFPKPIPNDSSKIMSEIINDNPKLLSPTEFDESSFRKQLRSSIDNIIFDDLKVTPSGELLMISQFDFSTDGDCWMSKITVLYFSNCLIFYDSSDKQVKGNLPIDQISSAVEISLRKKPVLVIELMSCSLPQVYLRCDEELTKTSDIRKWAFYLNNHREEKPSFIDLTECSISVMPIELSVKYEQEVLKRKITCQGLQRLWEKSENERGICLILCLSRKPLMNSETGVRPYIESILERLAPNDTLGIVSLGKDGKGDYGPFGTFVGPIDKYWSGWSSVLNDIEKDYSSDHFYNFLNELEEHLILFDTCFRLISTMTAKDTNFSRQLVLLENDILSSEHHTFNEMLINDNDKIKSKYDFVTIQNRFNVVSRKISEPLDIDLLRNWDVSNITLKRNHDLEYVWLGHMHFGETKTVKLPTKEGNQSVEIEWYDNNTNKHHVKMYTL